jgi:ABC-2 family transporter protein
VLGGYAAFHALVGTVCLIWAILRLRTLALRDEVRGGSRKRKGGVRVSVGAGTRRPVGRYPMVWKEVFAEGGVRLNMVGRIVAGVLFVASFLPAIIILWLYLDGGFHYGYPGSRSAWEEVGGAINAMQVRFVGTTVAFLMLLAVVVRAAGSVRSERERNTLDELLTTRLTNPEILFGKWLGSILSVRWGWAWLGMIWLVGVLMGGVKVYALPLILAAWVVYAAVGAGIGLWFSISSKTTLRATVAALMTMLFVCGGHWLVTGMFCYIPMAAFRVGGSRDVEWLTTLELGQTPPFVLGLFAYHGDEFEHSWGLRDMIRWTMSSLFGVGCWAALLPVLWLMMKRRFEQVTGRAALLHPEREMPRRSRRLATRRALIVDEAPGTNGPVAGDDIATVLPADEPPDSGGGRAV